MSLPLRSSVWSAESEPGTAGSGICLTQTATFIRLLFVGANRRAAPVRGTTILPIPPHDVETCDVAVGPGSAGPVPSVPMAEHVDVVVVGAGPAGTAAAITAVDRGLDGGLRRQGAVPPRQDVRRRAHRQRAAAPRTSWASPRPISTRPSPRSCARRCSSPRAAAGPTSRCRTDGAHAAVVTRRALDAALVDVARRRGVDDPRRLRGRAR